jgi:hypothetical protein
MVRAPSLPSADVAIGSGDFANIAHDGMHPILHTA